MSANIPSADTALLHAQAKAGPAGVEAYEQAKKELAAQQAAASAAAMNEAARRGTPDAALGVASSGLNDMYARRLASMTEAGALAGSQASSREARMADYSGAVGQARGLIADQVAQTVAPINAETDYRIKALGREGQNAVDRIEAQMRLDAARAAFEEANRGGGGGGGGRGGGGGGGGGGASLGSLNQTELRAAMTKNAQAKMGTTINVAQQAMRQTAEQSRQAASYAGRSAQQASQQNAPRNRAQEEAARQAGSYAAASMRPTSIRQAENTAADRQRQEQQRQATSYLGQSRPQRADTPGPVTRSQIIERSRLAPLPTAPSRSALAVQEALRQAGSMTARSGGRSASQIVAESARAMAAPRRANSLAALAAGRQAAGQVSPLYLDDNAPMFTPEQALRFSEDPDAALYGYLFNEANPARRIRSVDEILGGAPRYASEGSFRLRDALAMDGSVDDTARAAMRDAMQLSAFDLADQGYDITEPEIMAALDDDATWKPGSTYADVSGRAIDRGDTADQQEAIDRQISEEQKEADAAYEAMTDAQKAAFDAEDEQDRQAFAQTTGLNARDYALPTASLIELVASDNYRDAVDIASGAKDRDEVVRLLQENGWRTSDPYERTIIEIVADMLNV